MRYFGTDGIRGRVGEAPVTADFMLKLGWAAGKVLAGAGAQKVLIGKDTRISGYMFESALEAGLSAAGVNIALLGPMPTPAIAYLTRTLRAAAGIVISASHNPYWDNGIKFFARDGRKLRLAVTTNGTLVTRERAEKLRELEHGALPRGQRVEEAPEDLRRFHVVGGADHQLTGLVAVVIAEREPLNFGEDFVAEVKCRTLRGLLRHVGLYE